SHLLSELLPPSFRPVCYDFLSGAVSINKSKFRHSSQGFPMRYFTNNSLYPSNHGKHSAEAKHFALIKTDKLPEVAIV
ncbi:unnamed protein product, partial [Nesidiocoris tenuis]